MLNIYSFKFKILILTLISIISSQMNFVFAEGAPQAFARTFQMNSVFAEEAPQAFARASVSPVIPIISTVSDVFNQNNTDIISTDSQIFIHDGVKYKKGKLMGNFMLTGYCTCQKCTGGSNITYSGKPCRANHTIAADLSVLPLGTFVILEGTKGRNDTSRYNGVYQVEDKGGGVKNKHIDIYQPTHDEACLVTYHGKSYADVFIAIPII